MADIRVLGTAHVVEVLREMGGGRGCTTLQKIRVDMGDCGPIEEVKVTPLSFWQEEMSGLKT